MVDKCNLQFTKPINPLFTDLLIQVEFKVQDLLQALTTLQLEPQDPLLITLDTVLPTIMVVQEEAVTSRIVLVILIKVLVTVLLKVQELLELTTLQLVLVSYININYI